MVATEAVVNSRPSRQGRLVQNIASNHKLTDVSSQFESNFLNFQMFRTFYLEHTSNIIKLYYENT